MNAQRRPMTPDEVRAAARARVNELVWKMKLLNEEELADLVKQLGDEAPEILKGLRGDDA